MEVVDHLDQITARLRRMDDRLGGGPLPDLVPQHLRYVTGMLDERTYTGAVGQRLHGTAGDRRTSSTKASRLGASRSPVPTT